MAEEVKVTEVQKMSQMKARSENDDSTPALKDRFADVFGSLAELEAKHDEFVEKQLKECQRNWKEDPLLDDSVQQKKPPRDEKPDEKGDRKECGSTSRGIGERSSRYHRRDHVSRRGGSDDRSRSRGFQRPHFAGYRQGRGQARNRVPDYKVHPDKWVCYDLSDVDKSQLSERSNTAAALSFLSDLRKQKHLQDTADASLESDDVRAAPLPGSIVFKKPVRAFTRSKTGTQCDAIPGRSQAAECENEIEDVTSRDESSGPEKDRIVFKKPRAKFSKESDSEECGRAGGASYRGGALVMPEHVIGAATAKPKTKHVRSGSGSKTTESKPAVKLSYFEDEEGEASDGIDSCGEKSGSRIRAVPSSGDDNGRRERRNIRQTRMSDTDEESD